MMNTKPRDAGEPAFPCGDAEIASRAGMNAPERGMTLREYAAIRLRVPESGTSWLDAMILKSLRDELAGQAMAGFLASWPNPSGSADVPADCAAWRAYEIADAMLTERANR